MSVKFVFRHMDSSEAVETLATKKLEKITSLVDYPLELTVIITAEKLEQKVEITCRAEHKELSAQASTEDVYESLDEAIHKLETQLKKEREKRKGHQAAHKISRDGDHLADDIPADLPHAGKNQRG